MSTTTDQLLTQRRRGAKAQRGGLPVEFAAPLRMIEGYLAREEWAPAWRLANRLAQLAANRCDDKADLLRDERLFPISLLQPLARHLADYAGVEWAALVGPRGCQLVSGKRLLVIAVIRAVTLAPVEAIGRAVNRDHSSVLYAIDQVADWQVEARWKWDFETLVKVARNWVRLNWQGPAALRPTEAFSNEH